jgi:hypothetical protein
MGIVVAPIVEGKLEAWKEWNLDLNASRRAEFASFNARYGLTRNASWLAETPMGPLVVVQHEGPGEDSFMAKLGSSSDPFDQWFVGKIQEMHGLDVTATPPGPMPVLYTSFGVA